MAVLTRATIPARHWRAFYGAVPAVTGSLGHVGVGEWPVGLQATFSLWPDEGALRRFAYEGPHADVVRRARAEGWFREELFARFRVLERSGSSMP